MSSDGFGARGGIAGGAIAADMYVGDPSLKKMKEEIGLKEAQNIELQDEIKRLKYMLNQNVNKDETSKNLMKELSIKEEQMKNRDSEINELIAEKQMIESEKIELVK